MPRKLTKVEPLLQDKHRVAKLDETLTAELTKNKTRPKMIAKNKAVPKGTA